MHASVSVHACLCVHNYNYTSMFLYAHDYTCILSCNCILHSLLAIALSHRILLFLCAHTSCLFMSLLCARWAPFGVEWTGAKGVLLQPCVSHAINCSHACAWFPLCELYVGAYLCECVHDSRCASAACVCARAPVCVCVAVCACMCVRNYVVCVCVVCGCMCVCVWMPPQMLVCVCMKYYLFYTCTP